jgi:hypothetical protein
MKHYTLLVKQYEAGQKGLEKFMIRVERNANCQSIRVSFRDAGLYINFIV